MILWSGKGESLHGKMVSIPKQKQRELAASSCRLGRQLLSRSDLDVLVLSRRVHGRCSHTILDLLSHRHEGLFDIGGALGRSLQEGDRQLVGEFLSTTKIEMIGNN